MRATAGRGQSNTRRSRWTASTFAGRPASSGASTDAIPRAEGDTVLAEKLDAVSRPEVKRPLDHSDCQHARARDDRALRAVVDRDRGVDPACRSEARACRPIPIPPGRGSACRVPRRRRAGRAPRHPFRSRSRLGSRPPPRTRRRRPSSPSTLRPALPGSNAAVRAAAPSEITARRVESTPSTEVSNTRNSRAHEDRDLRSECVAAADSRSRRWPSRRSRSRRPRR